MKVIISGLPEEAKRLLKQGIDYAYSGLGVEIEELNLDLLPILVREAKNNPEVIYVILDDMSERACEEFAEETFTSEKYIKYTDLEGFKSSLEEVLALGKGILPDINSADFTITSGVDGEPTTIIDVPKMEEGVFKQILANLEAQLEEKDYLLQYFGSEKDRYQEQSHKQNILRDSQKLKDYRLKLNSLEKENKELKVALSTKEVELTDLYGVINEHELRFEKEKQELSNLESKKNVWEEEKSRIIEELDKVQGTLLRVRTERDGYKSDLVSLQSEFESVSNQLGTKLKEKESNRQLKESLKSALEEKTSLKTSLEKVTHDLESLEEQNKSNLTSLAETTAFLQEANLEILELKSKLQGYELSEKGMSEQSKKYSDLYENYLKLKADIFHQISINSFPKTIGTLRLEDVVTTLPRLSNIGFLMAGNGESQRSVYKYLREELLLCMSGLKTKTNTSLIPSNLNGKNVLLVDLSTETSLDYVFEVKGNIRSSLDWWRNGGGVYDYLNDTKIRGVKALMMGLGFCNDTFLLNVDWKTRLQELENTGYCVIFVGRNLSEIIGRVLYNSIKGNGKVVVGIDGLITNTRNSVINLQGFDNVNVTSVVINKTPVAQQLYGYLEGIVEETQYYQTV